MDPQLKEAARTGDFSRFYSLIEQKPWVLKHIDTESFVETPLHVAASEGQIAFAIEMMNLRPAFARTLNQAGLSAMHVAVEKKKTQLVHRLLKMNKDLARVKGREGKTPVHHAVEQGDKEILTEFLQACPGCIQDVTVHNDTAFHLALKWDKFEIFEFLVRWIRTCSHKDAEGWEERVLRGKDEQGNTLLHIAAIRNNLQAVDLLLDLFKGIVDTRARNFEDLTPEEYISKSDNSDESNENQSHEDTRSKIISTLKPFPAMTLREKIWKYRPRAELVDAFLYKLRRPFVSCSRGRKNISEDLRSALLVVLALIITTTYQSALSPPGGVWSGDNGNSTLGLSRELHHQPGTAIMQKNIFCALWLLNSLSLLMTIGLTVYILPGGTLTFLIFMPLSLLGSSYMLSMSILSPTPQLSKANKVLAVFIFMLPYIASEIPAFLDGMKSTLQRPRNISSVSLVYTFVKFMVVALGVIMFLLSKFGRFED